MAVFFIGVAKILRGLCVLCDKSISASLLWRSSVQNPMALGHGGEELVRMGGKRS
jgi:hypothetical protein